MTTIEVHAVALGDFGTTTATELRAKLEEALAPKREAMT
jgi:hypothetical protein